jgi:hypothetical protein
MSFLYNRMIMDWLPPFVEYLALDVFFSGGFMFWILELLYIYRFNRVHRMKVDMKTEPQNDHENPSIVSRNKRLPRCTLRAFSSVSFYKDVDIYTII